MDEFYRKIWSEFEEKLKRYLKDNLLEFGFEFQNDNDFIEFIQSRVNRIWFEDKPCYYEFYLDFINAENKGKFIGSYSDAIEIVNEGNRITAIIGKKLL